jgi:flavin reductase (DIM6/NTAB) family NADH-FMN oxidoreductase RutF/CheY-like chemotaxis protein
VGGKPINGGVLGLVTHHSMEDSMAQILVLDDVQVAVDAVRRVLERRGYEVVGFTDEDAAIDHVKNHPVDLAILDIKLKKMDGVQVLGKLKEIQPSIKVIMLTGYPTHATVEEAMGLGANAYCMKPIDRSEIESKVAEVLAQETHIELVRYPDKAELTTQDILFRSLTNGVYIVTVEDEGQINGVTTPWVTQLSYDPPMVMVAISPLRKCYEMITNRGQFAVNVLASGQVDVASRFGLTTGREMDKFEGVVPERTPAGNPLLSNVVAYIDCELVKTVAVGDHSLFVGEVIGVEVLDLALSPLTFEPSDYFWDIRP